MNIYTSYYAKVPKINIENYCLIRVSKSKPAWLDGILITGIPVLYPHWDLINDWKNGLITWDEYTERYLYQLSFVNREEIIDRLHELSNGKDIILLCYESNDKHCHRHILADWLGYGVKELIL